MELDDIDSVCERNDRTEFIDILKKMLDMDQDRRLTPSEGLKHAFVQMTSFIGYPGAH